jgi:hypothetical protein
VQTTFAFGSPIKIIEHHSWKATLSQASIVVYVNRGHRKPSSHAVLIMEAIPHGSRRDTSRPLVPAFKHYRMTVQVSVKVTAAFSSSLKLTLVRRGLRLTMRRTTSPRA